MVSPIGDPVAEAVDFYRTGKLDEAEQRCAAILQIDPHNFRVLALLGNLNASRGRYEEAIRLISLSLEEEPRQPFALNTLGNLLKETKRHQEAVTAFDKAIALKQDHAAAHHNRGTALLVLDRTDEALVDFDKSLELAPRIAEAHFGRGKALRLLERLPEALASVDKAIALKPDEAEYHFNRGRILSDLHRFSEAAESFDKAIAIRPHDAELHKHAGDLCSKLNRNVGGLTFYSAAVAFYDNAIMLRPDYAAAYHMRGRALRRLSRYEEALQSLDKALELDSALPYAAGDRLFIKANMCDWSTFDESFNAITAAVGNGVLVVEPFPFLSISRSAESQKKCASMFCADRYPLIVPGNGAHHRRHDRIRIAYVSRDFFKHAVAFLMAGVFEQHDRDRFEVFAFSFSYDDGSDLRARLENAFEHFIDVRYKNDAEVADLMRECEIDIAVDLKGYTENCRPGIFALRPAPIQVSYLGYPGTMGTNFIDYIVADRTVIPEDQQSFYAEKVVYLPDTYLCNDSKRPIAENWPTRAEAGLPTQGFVFCSFNNNYKIGRDTFDVWMRLLHKTEGSALWLREWKNTSVIQNLRREAQQRGIAPERLVFAPSVESNGDHLARNRLADLFLDTLPYCAHTTASDALWAGLPVLTCLGDTFAGRVAASLLYAIGLPELVTRSLEEYEAKALELSHDASLLAALKAKLARNRDTHPLFDTVRFTRHLESAYVRMAELHWEKRATESFAVDAVSSITA